MRIAMLGPFGVRPKGTLAVRALPLAKALVQRGHQAAMFLPPWSYPADAGRAWDDAGVRVENVAIAPRALIAPRLLARTGAWRPDVIHCFKPKAYAGLAQWLAWHARRVGLLNARIVLDTDDWEGAGGWNDLENYGALQKKFFAWQEQWGLRHADAVTVASRALETLAWSRGAPRARVYYLPNGVLPLPRADAGARALIRAEYGWGDEPVVLLYTRFFEFRVARVVEIFARVVERAPQARLLVVGKGLFGEEEELLTLARARNWQARVCYAGWVDPARLTAVFAAADVALFPFDDTLVNRCKCSVKLVDLLAAGVPVLADAVGQVKEYIAHDDTGVLVAPGGVEEFARACVELLRDAPRRATLGARAAQVMARDYGWARLAEVAEAAYAPVKSISFNSSPTDADALSSRRMR